MFLKAKKIQATMKKINLTLVSLLIFIVFCAGIQYNYKYNPDPSQEQIEKIPDLSTIDFKWSYKTDGLAVYQGVNDIDMSSNGSYIVVGTEFANVYLFHRSSNVPIWKFQEVFDNNVITVSISSDGKYIVAGFADGDIHVFNRSSEVPLWSYDVNAPVRAKISSDGKYIVAGSNNHKIYLFNTTNSVTPLLYNYTTNDYILSVAISSDGSYFVGGSYDSNIYLFNNSGPSFMWNFSADDEIWSVDMTPDGNYIVAGSADMRIYLFNKSSSIPISNTTKLKSCRHLAISDDGNYIAAIGGKQLFTFKRNMSETFWTKSYLTLSGLAFSSNGKYLVVAGEAFYVHHITSPYPLWSFNAPYEEVCSISDDGKYITLGTWWDDRTIYLFENNPPTLSSNAQFPDANGDFTIFWDFIKNNHNFSLYQHDSYITDINETETIFEGVNVSNYSFSNFNTGDYYYLVIAHNGTHNLKSNCLHIRVERHPMDFYLSSTVDPIDIDGAFTLEWNVSTYAKNYSVFIHNSTITGITPDVNELASNITNLYYHVSGLNNGDYFFVVVAYNEFGSKISNCINVSVRIPPRAFTLHTNAGDPDIDGMFNLNWEESVGAENYSVYGHIEFIFNLTGSEVLIAENVTDLTYPISGLSVGDYFYIVAAYNRTGITLSNCIKVSVRIPPGDFVLNHTADNPDEDGIFDLIWTGSKGADNYSVFVYHTPITVLTSDELLVDEGITDLIYNIMENTSGRYYYVVVAYNRTGRTISNYVRVKVELPEIPDGSPKQAISIGDFGLYTFAVMSICLVFFIRRKKINLK